MKVLGTLLWVGRMALAGLFGIVGVLLVAVGIFGGAWGLIDPKGLQATNDANPLGTPPGAAHLLLTTLAEVGIGLVLMVLAALLVRRALQLATKSP